MVKPVNVSVIIPTYGRPENLKVVFSSLEKQDYKNFEVVAVEGLDLRKTKAFLQKNKTSFPVRVVKQKGRGLVNAVNEGVKYSAGSIIIRTDDDVIFSKSWLKSIVATFNMSNKIGGVSGPTIIPEDRRKNRGVFVFFERFRKPPNIFWRLVGKLYISIVMDNQPLSVGRIFKSGTFSLGSNYPSCLKLDGPQEVDYLEACNFAVYKKLVLRVGGFDEGYVGVGEWHEPDVCFKIRKLGYRLLFNPKAKLNHLVSQGGIFSARGQTYSRSTNFIRFYYKHIKPDSLEKIFKFSVNLWFINCFYLYSFLSTGKLNHLTGIWGTVVGLFRNGLGLKN